MFYFRYFNDESVLERVPRVFLLLSGCYIAMQVIGAALLFSPPEDEFYTENNDPQERQALVSDNLVNGSVIAS